MATPAALKKIAQSYGRQHKDLAEALSAIPGKALHYKPAPDKWSIHEIVWHLLDSEANLYVRYRAAIAEPGKLIMAFEQDDWNNAFQYEKSDLELALKTFKWLRRASVDLLARVPKEAWKRTIKHPERGVLTLEKLLASYHEHVPVHLKQIERTFEAWKQSKHPPKQEAKAAKAGKKKTEKKK
jgi:hypothetical protein